LQVRAANGSPDADYAHTLVDLARVHRLASRPHQERAALEEAVGLFRVDGKVSGHLGRAEQQLSLLLWDANEKANAHALATEARTHMSASNNPHWQRHLDTLEQWLAKH